MWKECVELGPSAVDTVVDIAHQPARSPDIAIENSFRQ